MKVDSSVWKNIVNTFSMNAHFYRAHGSFLKKKIRHKTENPIVKRFGLEKKYAPAEPLTIRYVLGSLYPCVIMIGAVRKM